MGSSETIFSNVPVGNTYRLAKTISVPTRQEETTHISFEIVAVPLGDRNVEGDESQMAGQWLLWLIAVIYLALVLALYLGVYVALKALSVLTGAPG